MVRLHVRVKWLGIRSIGEPAVIGSAAHEKGGRSFPPGAASPSHHDPRIRTGASMTTFSTGETTHQAVLPQQPALESASADTPGNRDETAHGLPAIGPGTGAEHGRGETGAARTGTRRRHARPAASAAATAENRSGDAPRLAAGRVFVLAKGVSHSCPVILPAPASYSTMAVPSWHGVHLSPSGSNTGLAPAPPSRAYNCASIPAPRQPASPSRMNCTESARRGKPPSPAGG